MTLRTGRRRVRPHRVLEGAMVIAHPDPTALEAQRNGQRGQLSGDQMTQIHQRPVARQTRADRSHGGRAARQPVGEQADDKNQNAVDQTNPAASCAHRSRDGPGSSRHEGGSDTTQAFGRQGATMRVEKSWPEGTFVWEGEEQEHYCGSHWDPFYDSPGDVLEALSVIIPDSVPLQTFGDARSGPHDIPAGWTTGGHLCWPNSNRGLVATLRETGNDLELTNICPFAGVGIEAGIEIEKVHVWPSGAEAQIKGVWGGAAVSFFDLAFLDNRAWYEAGERRQFDLAGIAYEAGAPKVDTLAMAPDSPLANWQRDHAGIAGVETANIGLNEGRFAAMGG